MAARGRPLRENPSEARRARRVYAASLGLHVLALSSLALVPIGQRMAGKAAREARIEVAWAESSEPLERESEPEPQLAPVEIDDTPALVERELPPEALPSEAPPPEPIEPQTPLDDRAQLVDPLRDVATLRFTPPRPPAPEAVAAIATSEPSAPPMPPPQPAVRADFEPEVLADPTPEYPHSSRRMGHEGSVTLRARVAKDGSVIEVTILTSSGFERLDESARSAFLEWRFRPWRDGEPAARSYRKTFTFRLP